MNTHDSERLAGLLDEAGYQPAADGETPDVVVFNTCAVRENAADRLYGNLGHLLPQKKNGMQIAVGGCLAQMERTKITQRAPWVDVVYGTHNMASLPALLERARVRNEAQVEFAETLETFPSLLPARRQSAYSGWVSISVGCNNTCTFCIVPSLRGKERDRRPGDILAEIGALVADGVLEVTLLGQNVNSYGAEFGDRQAFGKLLRSCGDIEGLERVRFTSPHPRDFTDDVIDAMAQTPNVMPSLHMPLQSGSDTVLKAMRRAYRRDRYLAILDRVRAAIPGAAITTDIIVGFPGETDEDFEDTLALVRQAHFAGAFTFRYSIRPGTPAATMDGQVPSNVVQERYDRLTALVEETTFAENRKLTGATVEVLVAEGEGRKDAATHRMSGRARDNRLVHFAPHESAPRPGDVVTVTITRAAPHYLLSDAEPLSIRRTRAGDAWEAVTAAPATAAPATAAPATAAPATAAPATAAPATAAPATAAPSCWACPRSVLAPRNRPGRRLRHQDDLAAGVAGGQRPMGGGHFGQRIGRRHDDPQLPGFGEPGQLEPGGGPDLGPGVGPRRAADHLDPRVEGPPARDQGHDLAAVGHQSERGVERLVPADAVDGRVDATRGQRPDPLFQPGPVQNRLRAELPQQLMAALARRADHARAGRHRKLHGHQARAARGAVDQDGLARADPDDGQRVRGGHAGQHHPAGLLERQR